MFGALKTVEDHNLYASFGLVDGLSENELTDINGGDCTLSICFSCSFSIFGGSKSGDNNSGGSSGSNSSSESGSSSSSSSS